MTHDQLLGIADVANVRIKALEHPDKGIVHIVVIGKKRDRLAFREACEAVRPYHTPYVYEERSKLGHWLRGLWGK